MKPSHKLSRRSFFASVVGGVLIGGGSVAILTGRARAQSNQTYTGVTDSDTGAGRADRPGYGTGVRNRYTDRDTGPNADPQFGGRGPNARPEGSVSGQGRYGGVAPGCSDSDGGPGADPAGRGSRCNGQIPYQRYPPTNSRHCTDSDRGTSADPVQQGVRC